eukprot:CAMPEP_0206618632 /NCGR_PEP_ID=MMETSP0325_2-20121206/60378_1 /ASSEMBLY_ACC=CAM_ASM_000347 /TAXON_ID=2866 /ORGANISM="Crypthecodinium cohnii, Strain Seligo" /LENGTH=76 /DNA_ID=CAMNT_0054140907 /DNA_START=169 /DNA_END=399 /DNA_ORIENTATION=+
MKRQPGGQVVPILIGGLGLVVSCLRWWGLQDFVVALLIAYVLAGPCSLAFSLAWVLAAAASAAAAAVDFLVVVLKP